MKEKKKKSTFFGDFKKFLSRGNIVDLAVAVIIGAAFGKIVSSLVNDILMPLISLALGGISFNDLKWVIRAADEAAGVTETALHYGMFIQSILDFLIIAFCIFMIIRLLSKAQNALHNMQKKESAEEVPAAPVPEAPTPVVLSKETELLTEIRDLLKEHKLPDA